MATVRFVLVRPERPANVGAAARALKNFGFRDLALVGTREALPGGAGHGEARALAWNAGDVLDGARWHASLAEAIGGARLTAAATSRSVPGLVGPRELAAEVASLPADAEAAIVLGPEDHGLSNEELDLCRVSVRIPTRSEQPSLNLAQSVVVLAYELALALEVAGPPAAVEDPPAREADVERLAEAAGSLLLRAGYLNPQAPQHVLGELRRLLARSRPSAREITLLLGLVAQLEWAAARDR